MNFSFRIDTATLCVLSGVVLALWVTQDICTKHQVSSGPRAARVLVSERVVTREFTLVDDNGQTRARIGMNELNAPALSLNDKNGQERGLLRLNQNDVPSLRLYDANGSMREGMGFAQGTLEPHLWFYDQNGVTNEMIPSSGIPGLNFPLYRHNYNNGILWNSHIAEKYNESFKYQQNYNSVIQWNAGSVGGSADSFSWRGK